MRSPLHNRTCQHACMIAYRWLECVRFRMVNRACMRMLLRMTLVLTVFLVASRQAHYRAGRPDMSTTTAATAIFVTDTAAAAVAACGMCVD